MKINSIGAFLQAAFFIIFFLVILVIMPAQGFAIDKGSLYIPDESLAYAVTSPMLRIFYLQYFLIVIGLALLIPTMHKCLYEKSPYLISIAALLGIISAFLFFLNTTIGFLNMPLLLNLSAENAEAVRATYLSIALIAGAMVYGAFFTYGWWVSINSYVALQSNVYPKLLNYIGLLLGVISVLSFFITTLSFIMIVLSVVWSIYLGIVLLQRESV